MSRKSKVALVCVAAILVAAVAIPAGATAVPGLGRLAQGRSAGVAPVANVAQGRVQARLDALKARIVAVLQRRKTRFDSVVARVTGRIASVSAIADKVEAAGGDESAVRGDLDQARQHLAQAQDLEAQAVAAFQAVPDAPNKLAAFIQARGIGRQAGNQLRQSRAYLLSAVRGLRAQVRALKASGAAGAGANATSTAVGGGNASP